MGRVVLVIWFAVLAATGCQPAQPPLPADVLPLPENPSAEIMFLQARDQVTGIRVRTEFEPEEWFEVPADRVDALFAALQPVALATGSHEETKCELAHHVRLQGDDKQSLTVYLTSYGHTAGFEARGHYQQTERRIPVHYFGHDAKRLLLLLREVEMLAYARRSAAAAK